MVRLGDTREFAPATPRARSTHSGTGPLLSCIVAASREEESNGTSGLARFACGDGRGR